MIKLSKIKFDELKREVENEVKRVYNKSGKLYSNASPYGQILTVITAISHLIFEYIENLVTELLDLRNTNNPNAIRNVAAMVGYNPTRAISAKGSIILTLKKGVDLSKLQCAKIILPDKIKLQSASNGLYYSIILGKDEIIIELTTDFRMEINIIQGEFRKNRQNSNGRVLQSYQIAQIPGSDIEHFNYEVRVNGTLWEKKDSLLDLNCEENSYYARTGYSGGLDITFGNGYHGKVPPRGTLIEITYLLTRGINGNINLDSNNDLQFQDDIRDIFGNLINLNDYLNIEIGVPIIFASNAEDINFTKEAIPNLSRNYVLVQPKQYISLLSSLNMFSNIDVFSGLNDTDEFNDNVIYAYLIPNLNLYTRTQGGYFELEDCTFYLDDQEKQRIYDYINGQGIPLINTVFSILDVNISRYVINLYIIFNKNANVDLIRDEIINKISDYMINLKIKYIIPKSDITDILKDMDGVHSITVEFISDKNEAYHLQSNKNKGYNSNLIQGLDERGNIIFNRDEIPVIRGGFIDRSNIKYLQKPNKNSPSAINIIVEKFI